MYIYIKYSIVRECRVVVSDGGYDDGRWSCRVVTWGMGTGWKIGDGVFNCGFIRGGKARGWMALEWDGEMMRWGGVVVFGKVKEGASWGRQGREEKHSNGLSTSIYIYIYMYIYIYSFIYSVYIYIHIIDFLNNLLITYNLLFLLYFRSPTTSTLISNKNLRSIVFGYMSALFSA